MKIKTPAGTTGLAVEPWAPGEIYAVAADWAQASSPVLIYGEDGWDNTQYQVADFRHRVEDALRTFVIQAIALSEGIPSEDVDDDEVDAILDHAYEIGDTDDEDEDGEPIGVDPE